MAMHRLAQIAARFLNGSICKIPPATESLSGSKDVVVVGGGGEGGWLWTNSAK